MYFIDVIIVLAITTIIVMEKQHLATLYIQSIGRTSRCILFDVIIVLAFIEEVNKIMQKWY